MLVVLMRGKRWKKVHRKKEQKNFTMHNFTTLSLFCFEHTSYQQFYSLTLTKRGQGKGRLAVHPIPFSNEEVTFCFFSLSALDYFSFLCLVAPGTLKHNIPDPVRFWCFSSAVSSVASRGIPLNGSGAGERQRSTACEREKLPFGVRRNEHRREEGAG